MANGDAAIAERSSRQGLGSNRAVRKDFTGGMTIIILDQHRLPPDITKDFRSVT